MKSIAALVGFGLAFGLMAGAFAGPMPISAFPVACHAEATVVGRAESLLPNGKSFKLVWHDEFDGTTLDATKWSYRTNFWGRRFAAFAMPEDGCVEVRDGTIRLKVRRRADGHYCSPQLQTGELIWDYPKVPFGKGYAKDKKGEGFWPMAKREKPKFAHAFGYYECRCRLQRKPGWWSAFWMQSVMNGTCLEPALAGIEHDIMESFEPGKVIPSCFHMNGYGPDYAGFSIPESYEDKLEIDCETFHVFGLLWDEKGYSVYVDGRFRGRDERAVSRVPEFVLLTTECKWYREHGMTGEAVPELAEAVAAHDDFEVDYVRVYDVVPLGKGQRP